MRYFLLVFLLCSFFATALGQVRSDSLTWDGDYLEDQFYLGLTYNFLLDRPSMVSQRNFSYGLQGGFIKDIPINSTRTFALGIGLGYAVNSYYSNLRASETNGDIGYTILDGDTNFRRSKVETHLVELPLELRWRNSTVQDYKFWRVYTGFRLGYVFSGRSKFVSNDERFSFSNPDIGTIQYGLTLNFGYNTFNVHLYYALNNLFEEGVVVNGEDITMKPMRVGLIFYIL